MVDLDALKALLEKATPGKWDWGEPWAGFCAFTVDGKTVIYTATADCPNPENDHKFMAAMADAAPDLIAELEAAREALKAAKAALDTFSRAYVVSMEPFISGIDQADGASHWMPGGWPTVGEFKAAHEALTAIRAAKGGE